MDDLSAPVLCLDLPVRAECELAPWINWHVRRGEPYHLSWRMVERFEPAPDVESVFVCENPAIVSEAASRLGPAARPLICTNGVPASAVGALLATLSEAEIVLQVRADFDWTGLRIVDRLLRIPGSQLWRMTVADYRACNPSEELRGTAHTPSWGEDLAAVMTSTGLAAFEEGLVDQLIQDLNSTLVR